MLIQDPNTRWQVISHIDKCTVSENGSRKSRLLYSRARACTKQLKTIGVHLGRDISLFFSASRWFWYPRTTNVVRQIVVVISAAARGGNWSVKLKKGYFHPTPKCFDISRRTPKCFDNAHSTPNSVNLTVMFNIATWNLIKCPKYPLSWIREELNEIKC